MSQLAFAARLALAGLVAAAAALPVRAEDAPPPAPATSSRTVEIATEMSAHGQRAEAIAMLDEHMKRDPGDERSRQVLLSLRIEEKEAQIRANLNEQARTRELLVGDPDDMEARSRASEEVRRRLDVVDYFIAQKQYQRAVEACDAILRDHPQDTATLQVKLRVLGALEKAVDRERTVLLKDEDVRHDEAINEVIQHETPAREKDRIARTVLVFDEDVAEFERQQVREKLKERIDFVYKQAKVREAIETMFKIADINYVILDTAVGDETISTNLMHESIANVLRVLSKQINVAFNYAGGTVFISQVPAGANGEVFETEIIHLKAGLTDVQRTPKLANLQVQGQQNGQNGQNGGYNGQIPGLPGNLGNMLANQQQQQNGNQNQQQAPSTDSDLQRFIDKIPDLIVGWPADAKIYLERKSNTVYVRSTPATIAEVKRLLRAIDYDSVQVLIEARFVEVTESAGRELGINWQAQGLTDGGHITGTGTIDSSGANVSMPNGSARESNGLVGVITGANLGHGIPDFRATLSALEQNGKADTLSEPKIIAINNATGVIEVLRDINYVSGYTNLGISNPIYYTGTGAVPPTNNSENQLVPQTTTVQDGITLEITPSVARNSDVISLALAPMVRVMIEGPRDFQPSQTSSSSNTTIPSIQLPPRFDTRRLSTILHVQNGQTVVLGGLETAANAKSDAGLPWLAHVPGLGALFGRQSRSNQRRNLLIFVTAHIIDPGGAKVGEEIRTLRDTARVVLSDPVRAELGKSRYDEAKKPAAPAADAAAPAPAPKGDDNAPAWQNKGRSP